MKNEEGSKSQAELDETTAIRYLFAQFTLKGKIKKFGEDRENVLLEEIQQLRDRSTFKQVDWKQLSREQKSQNLGCLMFIKQKRCGRLKGRTCADVRKQRDKFTKEET